MLRSIMQVYVKASVEAVQLYQRAFNAKLISEHQNEDGSYLHAELDIFGQILALSESTEEKNITGNTMQFCLQFNEADKELVEKAFRVLEKDAQILFPLGTCFFSSCMVGFIDKFGVNWCLFV